MKAKYLSYYLILLFYCIDSTNAQTIRTIAGNGANDTANSGRPALQSSIGTLGGITIDNNGNLFTTDQYSNLIYKISTDGIVSHIAGTGYPGFTGDGGPATDAQIQVPFGITRDPYGNFFVAENGSAVIRKIDASGIIHTVGGQYGMYAFCCDGGPATNAHLGACGITLDSIGNIFVADCNGRIRKIDTGGIITTVAGTSSIGYGGNGSMATAYGTAMNGPVAVAVDNQGSIYISDQSNHVIRKVSPTGIISAICGLGPSYPGSAGDGGLATGARCNSPSGIKVDAHRNIYFCDQGNSRIRKIDSTGHIKTIAGTSIGFLGDGGAATSCKLSGPSGICFDSHGNMFIADRGNRRIREVIARTDTMHIAVSPGRVICDSQTVTFSVNYTQSPLYGAVYKWRINGLNVGVDSAYYTTHSLSDSDVVTCTLEDTTGGFAFAFSDSVLMKVNPSITPSVTIHGGEDTICTGFPVELIATSVNGGSLPFYQWKLQGVDTNTGNFFLYFPHDGDVVSCKLTSNAHCIFPDTAIAVDTLIVSPFYHPFHPIVTIHPYPSATASYLGQVIVLFAEVTYGGVHPIFKWYKNGALIPGADSASFPVHVYQSDTFTCNVISTAICIAPLSTTSPPQVLGIGVLSVPAMSDDGSMFALSPNPNNGVFSLNFNKPPIDGFVTILVRDLTGRIVYEGINSLTGGNTKLSVQIPEHVPCGMYFIVAKSGNENAVLPFVLSR